MQIENRQLVIMLKKPTEKPKYVLEADPEDIKKAYDEHYKMM